MDDTTPTGDPNTAALLTLGLVLYASLIFVGIALAIYYVRRNQKARAITAATAVGVLTVAGLVAAIGHLEFTPTGAVARQPGDRHPVSVRGGAGGPLAQRPGAGGEAVQKQHPHLARAGRQHGLGELVHLHAAIVRARGRDARWPVTTRTRPHR